MDREHAIIAIQEVDASPDLYLLIDFLNRTLKHKELIFGLSKASTEGKYRVTVYKTE
nr:DUF4264 family protein [Bacilli bacterium]